MRQVYAVASISPQYGTTTQRESSPSSSFCTISQHAYSNSLPAAAGPLCTSCTPSMPTNPPPHHCHRHRQWSRGVTTWRTTAPSSCSATSPRCSCRQPHPVDPHHCLAGRTTCTCSLTQTTLWTACSTTSPTCSPHPSAARGQTHRE